MVEENITQVDGSGWTLNDGGLQKSRNQREDILRNGVNTNTEESTEASKGVPMTHENIEKWLLLGWGHQNITECKVIRGIIEQYERMQMQDAPTTPSACNS